MKYAYVYLRDFNGKFYSTLSINYGIFLLKLQEKEKTQNMRDLY